MPAAAPWLDQAAPPQWTLHASQPEQPVTGGADSGALAGFSGFLARFFGRQGGPVNGQANNSQVDTTLHVKLAGAILIGLIVVFGLQAAGFRFVSSANVSLGR